MEVLLVLFFIGLFALIGHGIWVFLAWLFRIVFPKDTTSSDLKGMQRQLRRFREAGMIEEDQYRQLSELILTEQNRIVYPTPYTPPSNPEEAQPITPSIAIESEAPPPDEKTIHQLTAEPIIIPPGLPAAEKEPERKFSEVLASFLEDRNIRWGELIGGLLIVFCSTSLVIKFWSDIAQIPLLRFFLFNAMTASLFGAGLYTEHRWKLPNTSRGLLIIAGLLVPLSLLVISAFSQRSLPPTWILILQTGTVLFFLLLLYLAGKVLISKTPLLFAAAVLAPSAMHLFLFPFLTEASFFLQSLAAVMTVFIYVGANFLFLRSVWN